MVAYTAWSFTQLLSFLLLLPNRQFLSVLKRDGETNWSSSFTLFVGENKRLQHEFGDPVSFRSRTIHLLGAVERRSPLRAMQSEARSREVWDLWDNLVQRIRVIREGEQTAPETEHAPLVREVNVVGGREMGVFGREEPVRRTVPTAEYVSPFWDADEELEPVNLPENEEDLPSMSATDPCNEVGAVADYLREQGAFIYYDRQGVRRYFIPTEDGEMAEGPDGGSDDQGTPSTAIHSSPPETATAASVQTTPVSRAFHSSPPETTTVAAMTSTVPKASTAPVPAQPVAAAPAAATPADARPGPSNVWTVQTITGGVAISQNSGDAHFTQTVQSQPADPVGELNDSGREDQPSPNRLLALLSWLLPIGLRPAPQEKEEKKKSKDSQRSVEG